MADEMVYYIYMYLSKPQGHKYSNNCEIIQYSTGKEKSDKANNYK